jgi:hypothetical protein
MNEPPADPPDRDFGSETPEPSQPHPGDVAVQFNLPPAAPEEKRIDWGPIRWLIGLVAACLFVLWRVVKSLSRSGPVFAQALDPQQAQDPEKLIDQLLGADKPEVVAPPVGHGPTASKACAGLAWRPPEGAVEAALPEGSEGRFPLDAMMHCVKGVEADTQVRVWFLASGEACGLAVNTVGSRHMEVKACLLDRLTGTRIPELPGGDYATMDVQFD